ncbi:MAG TPA: glycosyltransferase family 4 protein [Oscillospiraceae bacterium]|nr:glycosyltransferase family 4 protein [Oscillospiraceae bacterium]
MRIGMFTDSYKPYTSGVVRSIETTTAKLTELGHEVYIFAPNYPNCEEEEGVFRFASVPTPTYPDFSIALPFSLNLSATVKRLDLDVIHVHSPFSMGLLGSRCAKRFDIPLVFTYHTMYDQYVHYLPFAQGFSKKVVLKLSCNFCNRCDLVIAPTNIVRQIIAPNVVTKVKAIPTGIEISEFATLDRQWLREQYQIPHEKKILLHLGRLGKEKNVGFLLQSYRMIRQTQPETVLVIVGDGPDRESLENQVNEMGLSQTVIFTGTMPREQVVNAYAGADLFIFASTTETQGLVLGEAKAAALPSVAVKALGAAEMVKDGIDGFLTTLSLDDFTARVQQLLQDEQLRQAMAARCVEAAEEISSINMAKKLVTAYEGAINDKQCRDVG